MTTPTAAPPPPDLMERPAFTEWMQEWVDGQIMDMIGSAEIEGSAFAAILQTSIRTFIECAERDLGIVLSGRGDLAHDYWTPEKHNAYHRAEARQPYEDALRELVEAIDNNSRVGGVGFVHVIEAKTRAARSLLSDTEASRDE